jgi:hypothetical protein
MAISEAYTLSAVTISTTEISIPSGTSTLSTITVAGVYQLLLDPSNMVKGDQFVARFYEKVLSSTTKKMIAEQYLLGAQDQPILFPSMVLLNGWDMTLLKLAGTDRAMTASIRKVA